RIVYGGPCPPRGHGSHHYRFRLLALSVGPWLEHVARFDREPHVRTSTGRRGSALSRRLRNANDRTLSGGDPARPWPVIVWSGVRPDRAPISIAPAPHPWWAAGPFRSRARQKQSGAPRLSGTGVPYNIKPSIRKG